MPACEDMKWAPTLQLSCCPICWREEEIVSGHNGGQHGAGAVCSFLLSRPPVACKETRFPTEPAICDPR